MEDGGVIDPKARLLWLWSSLVGQVVVVTCRDGIVWEGVLSAKSPDDDTITLCAARHKGSAKEPAKTTKTNPKDVVMFEQADVLYISAVDVALPGHEVASIHKGDAPAGGDRQLQKWMPEGDIIEDDCLEADGYSPGDFDQFEVNARKHNYTSTYSMDLYTTKLDKSKLTEEQMRFAEKTAKEIEGGGGGKYDSTIADWADDCDEETAHSAVIRSSDPVSYSQYAKKTAAEQLQAGKSSSSYIPPHLRSKMQPQQPQQHPQQTQMQDGSLNGSGQMGYMQQQYPNPTPQRSASLNPHQLTSSSCSLNPHVPIAQYHQDGQLQVRRDDGMPSPLPQECYVEYNDPNQHHHQHMPHPHHHHHHH
eukprot:Sspe_Gene.11801::Locus_4003_Transcript_1_2_Confidence_0.667_Length_1132::g.11801::m.11801